MRNALPAMLMALVAILAFTTPSEAGSTIVTTTAFLFEPVTVTDLFVKYELSGGNITDLKMQGAIPNEVTLSFNAITDIADVHYSSPVDATLGVVQQFSGCADHQLVVDRRQSPAHLLPGGRSPSNCSHL
jgi:hypothetical protein